MPEIPAQEILYKIERGLPVEYHHVIIKGDLDLSKLDLPIEQSVNRVSNFENVETNTGNAIFISHKELDKATFFSSPIRISDSIIEGGLYFNNTIFLNIVDFIESKFNGPAHFCDSAFESTSNFGESAFNGDADFRGSSFNGDANFRNSCFNENAAFLSSDFKGIANFGEATFNGDADFRGTSFHASGEFWLSVFNGTADFGGTAFEGIAIFGESAFKEYSYFWGSTFNDIASFQRSSFNRDASFADSIFKGDADFELSAFDGTADFGGSTFNVSDFTSAQFNKFVSFSYATFNNTTSFNSSRFKEDALFVGADFNGTLYLTQAKYDRLFISWKNINNLGYDDAAYLSLLENFKKLSYLEDYDGCYYEYRKEHRVKSWGGKYHAMHPAEEWIRKCIELGLEAFYGYGKRPIFPLIWSICTILFFGAFWRMGGLKRDYGANQGGILEIYSPRDAQAPKNQPWAWHDELRAIVDAMIFSATVFLSGTRLFVDPPRMPQMHRWAPSQTKAAFIAERVLGAFFSILFFLAISGTVVR